MSFPITSYCNYCNDYGCILPSSNYRCYYCSNYTKLMEDAIKNNRIKINIIIGF